MPFIYVPEDEGPPHECKLPMRQLKHLNAAKECPKDLCMPSVPDAPVGARWYCGTCQQVWGVVGPDYVGLEPVWRRFFWHTVWRRLTRGD